MLLMIRFHFSMKNQYLFTARYFELKEDDAKFNIKLGTNIFGSAVLFKDG